MLKFNLFFKKLIFFALIFNLLSCNISNNNLTGEYIITNGVEPASLLIPSDTSEYGGTAIIGLIFSGLTYYDEYGNSKLDLAESITTDDNQKYIVKIKDNVKFSDGSEIKAQNFVNAWNLAVNQRYRESSYLSYIKGYPEKNESFTNLDGLQIIDDKTFSIELKQPVNDFDIQLGQIVFYPLPDIAFKDINKFGENPIGSGPYKLLDWKHNLELVLVKNDYYQGPRESQNAGIKFVFYPQIRAAYADLLSGQLDILDDITDENINNADIDLDHRIIKKPTAKLYSMEINVNVNHFKNNEEGRLRRKAISMSIDRKEISDIIFKDLHLPAVDFTSPLLNGYDPNIKGADVLKFNPKLAKKLWLQANAISNFRGVFTLSYSSEDDDQVWVDAVCNQLGNNLGIKARGLRYPDAKSLLEDKRKRRIKLASKRVWFADYPSLFNFLNPIFSTVAKGYENKSGTNNVDYSNDDFDKLMYLASIAQSKQESYNLINKAQEILMNDLPAIPLWYVGSLIGFSKNVSNVKLDWKGYPIYYLIKKN